MLEEYTGPLPDWDTEAGRVERGIVTDSEKDVRETEPTLFDTLTWTKQHGDRSLTTQAGGRKGDEEGLVNYPPCHTPIDEDETYGETHNFKSENIPSSERRIHSGRSEHIQTVAQE